MVLSSYIVWSCVLLCRDVLCRAVFVCVVFVVLCCEALCCVVFGISCVSRGVVLRCEALCCVVFCCVVLRSMFAMSYYVVLSCMIS